MADLESGGHDADAAKISETYSPAADTADPYDVDPDVAAYAAGNNPELAHRYQGRADSPNSWNAYFSRPRDPGDVPGHAQPANERADTPEANRTTEPFDPWGDVEPDAARYADLDRAASARTSDSPQHNEFTPDRVSDTNAAQPDQTVRAEADPERVSALEQRTSTLEGENAALQGRCDALEVKYGDAVQRIDNLEAKNADLEQRNADLAASNDAQNADLRQQLADREQRFADYKASNDAEIADLRQQLGQFADLKAIVEQMQAGREHQPDGTIARERTGERPTASADQPQARDAANGGHHAAIAGQKEPDLNAVTKDAGRSVWRRATSAENVAVAGSLVQTADTVSQFAMHPGLEGVPGLTGALLVVASMGLTSIEKKRKG